MESLLFKYNLQISGFQPFNTVLNLSRLSNALKFEEFFSHNLGPKYLRLSKPLLTLFTFGTKKSE